MNWKLWASQIGAIARLELKRVLLARRWIGIYMVALAPLFLMFVQSRLSYRRIQLLDGMTQTYANLFQLFILRFGIFISCAIAFSQLFRGDVLEKTLHFYLLAPVRREIIAFGKYTAGVLLIGVLFAASTIATHFLAYWRSPAFQSFYFEGPGIRHLTQYAAVAILASIAYGAVFLLAGLVFKNPGVPAFFLLAWESLNFALPPLLQRFSVVHYLQALLPVAVDRGPFAIVTESTSPVLGVPILLVATAALVATSGWLVRYTQITYSAD